jgi:hypothetical protein
MSISSGRRHVHFPLRLASLFHCTYERRSNKGGSPATKGPAQRIQAHRGRAFNLTLYLLTEAAQATSHSALVRAAHLIFI